MSKKQRLERLFRVIEPAESAEQVVGFRIEAYDRDMHFALAEGTGSGRAKGSRMVSRFCRMACSRIVQDPFDPNAGIFRDQDGNLLPGADRNITNFTLIHLLAIYYNHFIDLRISAQKDLTEAIQVFANAQMRNETHFGYSNIVLMGIANRILSGEVLKDREMSAVGYRLLKEWLEFTALAGGPSEFNSPTYTGVCLHVIGGLMQWTRNRAVRLIASIAQERIWLHLANNYHKPTAQLGGPHSRAYHLDITFNPCLVKSALYAELGDERLMGPNHTLHDSDWSLYRMEFFLPQHVRRVLESKKYPFQAREVVSVYLDHPDSGSKGNVHAARSIIVRPDLNEVHVPSRLSCSLDDIRVRGDITCYQTERYSLGTVTHWQTSYQRDPLFATWVHDGDDQWDFFRCLFDRVLLNGQRTDWFASGRFYSCQEGGTALVVHRLPNNRRAAKLAINELKVAVVMPHMSQFDEIRIGNETLRRVPSEVGKQWVFLRDGDVYIGLLPLEMIPLTSTGKVSLVSYGKASDFNQRIETQETADTGHFGQGDPVCFSLEMQLYKGRKKRFTEEALSVPRCGYVIELASSQEWESFDAFCSKLQQAKIRQKTGRNREQYRYWREGRELMLGCDRDSEIPPRTSVNGCELIPRGLETPSAIQGRQPELRVAGCRLRKGSVPAWLVAEPEQKSYVVVNPSQTSTPIELETPEGIVSVEALACGRVICRLGRHPEILVESISDPGKVRAKLKHEVAVKIRTLIRMGR